MADYYVREEDGSSHFVLEDGSGELLLEAGGPAVFTRSAALAATALIAVSGTGTFDPTRISQLPVEVIVAAEALARTSQVPVEVIVAGPALARTSQVAVEVLVQGDALARVTQVPVEVIMFVSKETVTLQIIDYQFPGDA